MSTEQHPTWDVRQTREAIVAYLNSDDGQRYQKLYSEGANDEDLRVFRRDAEYRLVCKTDNVKTWWMGILECIGANPRHFLALAEPLCQLGKTPDDLYRALSHQFQVDALVQAYRRCGLGPSSGLPPGITDTSGWSAQQIYNKLEEVKKTLDWDNTTGSARKWWEAFENENKTRMPLVLRVAEELENRKATITEFYLSYVYSNTDNIQANLSYLDYTRLKREEDKKKREAAAASLEGRPVPAPPSKLANEVVLPPGITDSRGLSAQQINNKVETVKKTLDWDNTTGSARKWWEAFENENKTGMPLVLRLVEELSVRKATITEFFLAYVYSNTDNIQANLSYLDYTRLKKEEDQKKKEAAALELKKLQNSLRDQASAGQTAFRLSFNTDSGDSRSLTLCGENAVASLSDIFPDSDGSNHAAVLVAPVAVMLALVDLFVSWSEAKWRIYRVSTDQMSREGMMFEIAGMKEVLADFYTTAVDRKIELLKALVVQEFSPGNAQTTCLREFGEMLQFYKKKFDETKEDEDDFLEEDDFWESLSRSLSEQHDIDVTTSNSIWENAADAIAQRIRAIIVEQLGVSVEEVTDDASFITDLGADSIDIVELVMALEKEFDMELNDDDAKKIVTVGDIIRLAQLRPPE